MGSEVLTKAPQAAKITALLAKEIVDAIIKAIEAHEHNMAIKAILTDYKATGEIDVRSCEGYIRDGLERSLTEENIPYAFVQDEKSGTVFLITRVGDRDIVNNIAVGFMRGNTNIMTEEQLRSLSVGEEVYGYEGLSEIQAQVLQEQAMRKNIVVGVDGEKDNTSVVYAAKDRETMLLAGAKTAMLTTGVLGERSRFDLDNKTKRIENVVVKATTAKSTNDSFYITSPYSPAIKARVTPEGMTVYHGDSIYATISTSNPNYEKQVRDFAHSLSNPTILSPSRVEGQTTEDIMAASKQEMDRLPINEVDREAIIREQDARYLIETKLSLDNGPGHKYIMDFYNNNVSFGEFFELETRNDESDDAKRLEKAREIVKRHDATPEEREAFERVVSEKYNAAYTFIHDEHYIVSDRSVSDIGIAENNYEDISDYMDTNGSDVVIIDDDDSPSIFDD